MKSTAILLAVALSGCAVYRVAPKENSALNVVHGQGEAKIEITKLNQFPVGFQCFEPMLFVLTVGIVPVQCVDTYQASVMLAGSAEPILGTYEVTTMQGWLPLFLLPFPGWHYGYGREPQLRIEGLVRGD